TSSAGVERGAGGPVASTPISRPGPCVCPVVSRTFRAAVLSTSRVVLTPCQCTYFEGGINLSENHSFWHRSVLGTVVSLVALSLGSAAHAQSRNSIQLAEAAAPS